MHTKFFLLVFISLLNFKTYAQLQGGGQAGSLTEEQLIECGNYYSMEKSLKSIGFESFFIGSSTPSYCSNMVIPLSATMFGLQGHNYEDDLPFEKEVEQEICFDVGDCITIRFKFRYYRCGESICFRTIRIRKKCGLWCWEEFDIPDIFRLPTEIRPTDDDGWVCVDIPATEEPYTEGQGCHDGNGNLCSTDPFGETACFDSNGDPMTVPNGIPADGYGDPPADENP